MPFHGCLVLAGMVLIGMVLIGMISIRAVVLARAMDTCAVGLSFSAGRFRLPLPHEAS